MSRIKKAPALPLQMAFVVCGLLFLIVIWMLPAVLAGFPYDFPRLLPAHNLAEAGVFAQQDLLGRWLPATKLALEGQVNTGDGRLTTIVLSQIAPLITWTDLLGWTFVSAAVMALALFCWWLAVAKFESTMLANVSTILLAFSPLTWQQALTLNNYKLAFLFLFAAFAAYIWSRTISERLAVILTGALLGCSFASKDVFLIFLPTFIVGYLILNKSNLIKTLVNTTIFVAVVGFIYLLPYLGDIRSYGYPANLNLARLWPGAEEIASSNYLHLYPDPYTYLNYKSEFEQTYLQHIANATFVEKVEAQAKIIDFGVQGGLLLSVLNGFWLLFQQIPPFFHQGSTGGVLIYLFILPGTFVFAERHRKLSTISIFLLGSAYFIIAFILHFERPHVMDFGWLLMLMAGYGIIKFVDVINAQNKRRPWYIFGITALLVLHLLQANRLELARLYRASLVPSTLAHAEQIKASPSDAVIALPLRPDMIRSLAFLTQRNLVLLKESTILDLQQRGILGQVFKDYGVTHAAFYGNEAQTALEFIEVRAFITSPTVPAEIPVTPWAGYFLNLIH